jgi:hypothetical protein
VKREAAKIGSATIALVEAILQHGLDRAYANEKPPDGPRS